MGSMAEALGADVAAWWAARDLPSWPDPHAGREPAEEEYSRLTDPERYAVTHARATAWAEVLACRGVASVDEVEMDGAGRCLGLMPSMADAVPLLLVCADEPLPGLTIALGDPSWVLARIPDCGCDACDRGSADLLEYIDATVLRVVLGPVAMLRGLGGPGQWAGWWSPDAAEVGGPPGSPRMGIFAAASEAVANGVPLEQVDGLPPDREMLVSRPWV